MEVMQNMLQQKLKIVGILMATAIFLSGCRSLVIPQDQPFFSTPLTETNVTISSFDILSSGTLQDISSDNEQLLLLNTTDTLPTTYNIDVFDTTASDNHMTNFVNSDREKLSAAFDTNSHGVFYVEQTTSPTSQTINQLVWTSEDKRTTRTLSNTEESVNPTFHILDNGQILYSNNAGQIVITDATGNRTDYQLDTALSLIDLDYHPDSQRFVFLASTNNSGSEKNLYTAVVNAQNELSTPIQIDSNVLNFDLKQDGSGLIYTRISNEQNQIVYRSFNLTERPQTLLEGSLSSASYTPDNNQIIYAQFVDSTEQSCCSIWSMDASGSNSVQLTAPLNITSPIIPVAGQNNILYFSVEASRTNLTSNTHSSQSIVYRLEYTLDTDMSDTND